MIEMLSGDSITLNEALEIEANGPCSLDETTDHVDLDLQKLVQEGKARIIRDARRGEIVLCHCGQIVFALWDEFMLRPVAHDNGFGPCQTLAVAWKGARP